MKVFEPIGSYKWIKEEIEKCVLNGFSVGIIEITGMITAYYVCGRINKEEMEELVDMRSTAERTIWEERNGIK